MRAAGLHVGPFLVVPLLAACFQDAVPAASTDLVDATLEHAFGIEGVLQLDEDPTDSIAAVGAFTETASGRIVIPNSAQSNLTYLTTALAPDTIVPIPGPATSVVAMKRDLVVRMTLADDHDEWFSSRGRPPILHRIAEGSLVWSSFNYPFLTHERPYWSSLVGTPFAVGGDSIYAMSGARFPATILSGNGDTLGVIGTPSGSFRPIPVLEGGAFAGPRASGASFSEFLASFEFVERIDVVGQHLVFTRAVFDPARGCPSGGHIPWSTSTIDIPAASSTKTCRSQRDQWCWVVVGSSICSWTSTSRRGALRSFGYGLRGSDWKRPVAPTPRRCPCRVIYF